MFAIMSNFKGWQMAAADAMVEDLAAPQVGVWKSGIRFIASGGINTLATWALYAVLLTVLPYQWSFMIAYVLGIALAYLLYRFFVFRRKGGRLAAVWVAVIYLWQYLLGMALVHAWVRVLVQPQIWAPIFAVAVSMPRTFVLNRWVFRSRENRIVASPAAAEK